MLDKYIYFTVKPAIELRANELAILWLPLEKLRMECGVSRDGSKASSILKAARRNGCEARGFRWFADALLEKEFPLIIHWELE